MSELIIAEIYSKVAELLRILCEADPMTRVAMRETGGLRQIYSLLDYPSLRQPHALSILISVAKSSTEAHHVVVDLISALQTHGGTASHDPELLTLRQDILQALCTIFSGPTRTTAKEAFRVGGGFSWTVAVLDGIGRVIQDSDDKSSTVKPHVYIFLRRLLGTLSVVLSGHSVNRDYFVHNIRFTTLVETLQRWHFIESPHSIDICDDLLTLAVRGKWPPSCTRHPLTKMQTGSTLTNMELHKHLKHIGKCQECVDSSLYIEQGEIFKVIVRLLALSKIKLDTNRGPVLRIMKRLLYLVRCAPNPLALCQIGFGGGPL